MKKIENKIIQTLTYKGKDDLANLLINCKYELNASQSYGSRLYSFLTTVIIYVGIEKLDQAKNLTTSDKNFIIESFKVIYPIKEDSYEISELEFLQDPNAPIPGSLDMRIPEEIECEHWEKGFFKLFISHSSYNKKIAKEFKNQLRYYGISAFVAHEDISPSKEWLNIIESSLITCDGLLALLSSDFQESLWCDQEIGIAYGINKMIVPIRYGIDPYGFIGKYQALNGNDRKIKEITYDLWKTLISNELSSKKASYGFVKVFCESSSFDEAKRYSILLEEIKYFDDQLKDDIIQAIQINDQIAKSFGVKDNVMKLLKAKRKLIK